MEAQTSLIKTKTDESGVKQDVMRAQEDLIRANPLMRSEYVNAMVTQLVSAAKIKEQEASFLTTMVPGEGQPQLDRSGPMSIGFIKMDKELQLLFQRFDLQKADQSIKAKVMESKEFQNAILEIQKKWLSDGDITPQHIYQGIMMMLSKMM